MIRIHGLWLLPLAGILYASTLLPFSRGGAQGAEPLTAELDRTTASSDEIITLTVRIRGPVEPPPPIMPPLEAFELVGTSFSSEVQVVDGEFTAVAVHSFRLHPVETGTLTVGPISVVLEGVAHTTAPIQVEVLPGPGSEDGEGSQALLAEKDFFVEAEVDNTNPYLGQQVTYTFRFYRSASIRESKIEAPSFGGFWHFSDPRGFTQELRLAGGRNWIAVRRTLLFPIAAGSVTIEPTTLTLPSGLVVTASPELSAEPITLEVKPLPPGAPRGFLGAVGQFTISAEIEPETAGVNEPMTLTITLSGQGNLENLPDPILPELPDWRSFDDPPRTETEILAGRLIGSRVYQRVLVPGVAGRFTISPVSYVFFDPVKAEYRTVATAPIAVSVAADGQGEALGGGEGEQGSERRDVQVAADVRHIKPVPSRLRVGYRALTERSGYWIAWAGLLSILVLDIAWRGWRRRLQRDPAQARSLRALARAKKLLTQARRANTDVHRTVSQVLTGYLSDKLNQPTAGLTLDGLAALLAKRGIGPALVERVSVALATSERRRFAPVAEDPVGDARSLEEVEALIEDLEKGFHP